MSEKDTFYRSPQSSLSRFCLRQVETLTQINHYSCTRVTELPIVSRVRYWTCLLRLASIARTPLKDDSCNFLLLKQWKYSRNSSLFLVLIKVKVLLGDLRLVLHLCAHVFWNKPTNLKWWLTLPFSKNKITCSTLTPARSNDLIQCEMQGPRSTCFYYWYNKAIPIEKVKWIITNCMFYIYFMFVITTIAWPMHSCRISQGTASFMVI